jgi:integrase
MSTLPPAVEMHTDFPCHLRSVQALERVPRDGLTVDAAGEPHDVAADALDDDEHGVFTWKALGTVVGSMRVIVLFEARCCAKKPAECCGQVAGTGTLRHLLRLVRAALQDAVEEDCWLEMLPDRSRCRPAPFVKVTPWSADEARTFLETARHDRLHALWAVALAIGLRRGEALGLRWVDVDLVNGRVVIAKALSRVGTNLALRDVKTESSAASVPLPAELVGILRRHRLDQLGDTQVARANTLGLVFTTKNGTPLEPRNVNRAFETLCRRAGVRIIRLHDLRHSCATLLFTMGVEAATVQRVLRHSSI